jgi:hypothetical protein
MVRHKQARGGILAAEKFNLAHLILGGEKQFEPDPFILEFNRDLV